MRVEDIGRLSQAIGTQEAQTMYLSLRVQPKVLRTSSVDEQPAKEILVVSMEISPEHRQGRRREMKWNGAQPGPVA